jgi:hypothetical protein
MPPRQCLFCANRVDSAEHVWSDWILKELNPTQPIRIRIGKRTDRYSDNPEVLINCVCQKCNNGWMSNLESENQRQIGAMIHDQRIELEPAMQKALARWSVLKAMVIEAANRQRTHFYDESERQSLKPPLSAIPVRTCVWIGRFSESSFHVGGTSVWGPIANIPKALHGCVTTLVIGHLVIQIFTQHVLPMFVTRPLNVQCTPGPWDTSLLQIWPAFGAVRWPPSISFTKRMPNQIGALINRWKTGEDVG